MLGHDEHAHDATLMCTFSAAELMLGKFFQGSRSEGIYTRLRGAFIGKFQAGRLLVLLKGRRKNVLRNR